MFSPLAIPAHRQPCCMHLQASCRRSPGAAWAQTQLRWTCRSFQQTCLRCSWQTCSWLRCWAMGPAARSSWLHMRGTRWLSNSSARTSARTAAPTRRSASAAGWSTPTSRACAPSCTSPGPSCLTWSTASPWLPSPPLHTCCGARCACLASAASPRCRTWWARALWMCCGVDGPPAWLECQQLRTRSGAPAPAHLPRRAVLRAVGRGHQLLP